MADKTDDHDAALMVSPAAASKMPRPPDNLATPIIERHELEVEYYVPGASDRQTPHSRDELYVVASGSGWFVAGKRRRPVSAGDLIFVPARVPHRFEDCPDDFSTWVIFFGPES